MVSITCHPKVVNGVFAVPKDSDQDRLIIDAVFANAWLTTPAKVKLPDPSHLARLTTSASSGPLFVAKSDLSNFYHHLELPAWLRPYFCLVGIPAAELGMPGDGLVYPMLHTVPMGWSHSVNVAQAVHEHIVFPEWCEVRIRGTVSTLLSIGEGDQPRSACLTFLDLSVRRSPPS
jgi:hypothetical protein